MMPYGSSWEEELNLLFAALPPRIAAAAQRLSQGRGDLLEVVLDLGREPEARFTDGEAILDSANVGNAEIDYVTEHVGLFGDDNRAGIERTLHRISAIRNRKGDDRGTDLPGRARGHRNHRHHQGHGHQRPVDPAARPSRDRQDDDAARMRSRAQR